MHLHSHYSLKPFNSFGIEARARLFGTFGSTEELAALLGEPGIRDAQKLVLGGGSNILLTRDFDGAVLKNEIIGLELVKEDEDHVYIKTGAGENWHRFVCYCVDKGYAGVENLSLIPGCNGASPMQNIGAYGVEIKDVFYELEAYHLGDRAIQRFGLKDCAFGYRESVFKNKFRGQFVITSVSFRLDKRPVFHTSYGAIQQELDAMGVEDLSIKAIAQAVINIRSSKLPDPKETGNAGSFFKNPQVPNEVFSRMKVDYPSMPSFPVDEALTKIPAGWLIEQCGWKGFRRGDAGCYPKQALVLVNYGSATGEEIFQLSEEIIASVKEKFGVELEREVNII